MTNWVLSLSLFFQSGPFAPGGAAFFLYVVGLLWTVAMSVAMLRTGDRQLTNRDAMPQPARMKAA
jgi:hypothetical protein